jgi:hypothetical protein
MMTRILLLTLVAAMGWASTAAAGESLLVSGTRQVQQMTASHAAASSPAAVGAQTPSPSFQTDAGPGNLSKSSHSKMTKALIYTAIGAGFAISAWQIDKHVLNITPSSLGQRKD